MEGSKIEWTTHTWNPVSGCTQVSPGCDNCYAKALAERLRGPAFPKGFEITLRPHRLRQPRNWLPSLVFVNSMSDLFHDLVSDEFILKVWEVMSETPQHNYQILTKRPDRMAELVSNEIDTVLPNVWLGTSVENVDVVFRIDELRQVPASVRFISFEPLIGPVGQTSLKDIHWAIVGGESGASARPIQEDWIDEIHELCREHHTAFFFKQWGTWGADNKKRSKKANGRQYRGRTWDEMPSVSASL